MVTVESETNEREESFRGDLRRLGDWIRGKRNVIVIVCLWTAVLSSVIIWEYYTVYANNPILSYSNFKIAFAPTYESEWTPKLYALDYLIILIASVLAGYAIADIEDTLFGLIASGILSTLIGVAYSTLFIWYVLGFSSVLDISDKW
jgi:hypothetical protein